MVSAGDFRNGVTIEMDGQVVQIVEFQHVKPGKGAAFVRTKLRNVINGGVTDKTFRPTEKFPAARIDRVDMQYLYDDGEMYNFMNNETFEQIALSHEQIADSIASCSIAFKACIAILSTKKGFLLGSLSLNFLLGEAFFPVLILYTSPALMLWTRSLLSG